MFDLRFSTVSQSKPKENFLSRQLLDPLQRCVRNSRCAYYNSTKMGGAATIMGKVIVFRSFEFCQNSSEKGPKKYVSDNSSMAITQKVIGMDAFSINFGLVAGKINRIFSNRTRKK